MPEEVTPPTSQQVADLPEWARAYISDLRSEAASNRVKASEANTALTEANNKVATLNNELAEAKTATDTANAQVLRMNAALKAGVPANKVENIAKRLTGSTAEELEADAKALVADLGVGGSEQGNEPYVDPSQGRGGGSSAPNTNLSPGAAAFRKMVEGHYMQNG
jgi:murein L,D-transpeptidase YcbB/YkuD